jgi:3-oxoacyl-[acyl-carrier protein] reductase
MADKLHPMKASDLFNLAGQVALVTGASSGLGVRFAQVLAANGAAVVLVARRAERLAKVKTMLDQAGARSLAVPADVLDRAAMQAAFDAAEAAFGPVTILINNAGVAHAGRAVDLTEDEWRRVLSVDLDAVFYWAQEGARRMLAAAKGGAIINIASILGLRVAKGVVAYATAKAGVIQVTKAMAAELAFKGIRVNALAPGYIATELNREFLEGEGAKMTREIPAGRFGTEADLDGALLLLASDAGRYINGEVIVVDGGHTLPLRG